MNSFFKINPNLARFLVENKERVTFMSLSKFVTVALLLVISQNTVFAQQKTENVFIIMTDGFRWQDLYGGADSTLMNSRTAAKLLGYDFLNASATENKPTGEVIWSILK
jgi:hypothetical protein